MSEAAAEWRPAILLVDDDPAVREALACGLADRYTIHTAATGPAAGACLRAARIALIILDADLGDADGLDLVPRLRLLSLARILLLTGYGTEALAVQTLRAGVDDYLTKPVRLAELRATVGRLLAPPSAPLPPAARAKTARAADPPTPFRGEACARRQVSEVHLRRLFRAADGTTL